jgi:hypothetical protein
MTTGKPARPDEPDDGGLLPSGIRHVVYGILALLLTFACYLFLVRGPALLLDLAHSAYAMFCL